VPLPHSSCTPLPSKLRCSLTLETSPIPVARSSCLSSWLRPFSILTSFAYSSVCLFLFTLCPASDNLSMTISLIDSPLPPCHPHLPSLLNGSFLFFFRVCSQLLDERAQLLRENSMNASRWIWLQCPCLTGRTHPAWRSFLFHSFSRFWRVFFTLLWSSSTYVYESVDFIATTSEPNNLVHLVFTFCPLRSPNAGRVIPLYRVWPFSYVIHSGSPPPGAVPPN